MIRTILKLVFVALLANATWHLFGAYAPYYKFKDAVQFAAQNRGRMSDGELQQKVIELAAQFEVPVEPDAVLVSLEHNSTIVDASYVQPVDLVPGFTYPWPFRMHVDVITHLESLRK